MRIRSLFGTALLVGLAGLFVAYVRGRARRQACEALQRAEERWESEGGPPAVAT